MKRFIYAAFPILLVTAACSQVEVEDAPVEANLRSLAYYETELAQSSSKFAIDLFHQLNQADEPNQFYSPYFAPWPITKPNLPSPAPSLPSTFSTSSTRPTNPISFTAPTASTRRFR